MRRNSGLNRKHLLILRFLRLVLPFLDAGAGTAEREEFLFVVDHLFASEAAERIVLLQEDRFLRADFLAEAAENAAEHVDFELLRHLLRVGAVGDFAGR